MENQKKSQKKTVEGSVVSNKMTNAVVVLVSTKYPHPKYGKIMTKNKKYYAQTLDSLNIGDTVVLEESRPLSKLIRWKVIEVKKS